MEDFTELLEDDDFEFVERDERRNVILIIYDIVDNRRRYQMVKFLEGYGVRVQKSAFEAMLTKKKFEQFLKRAPAYIDPGEDSLRIYALSSRYAVRSWGIGDRHTEDVIIV